MTFRKDTSFPFLKIAIENGIDYGRVLFIAEHVERLRNEGYSGVSILGLTSNWRERVELRNEIYQVVKREQFRRAYTGA